MRRTSLRAALRPRRVTISAASPRPLSMGHVHLYVAAILETIAFYRDVLGFGADGALGDQAGFLARAATTTTSAPTRGSRPAPAPPSGLARLERAPSCSRMFLRETECWIGSMRPGPSRRLGSPARPSRSIPPEYRFASKRPARGRADVLPALDAGSGRSSGVLLERNAA